MAREQCDLTHQVATCGKIGRLHTVARIPTVAGDSFSGKFSAKVRLNPMRRPLVFDLRADLYAFWQPYRWTYGNSAWINLIETRAVPGGGFTRTTLPSTYGDLMYLMAQSGSQPAHILSNYLRIVNKYFRDPNLAEITSVPDTYDQTNFGSLMWNLQTIFTAMSQDDSTGGNAIPSSSTVLPRDIIQYTQTLRATQLRDVYAHRFEEVHQKLFGVAPSQDADDMPHILGITRKWMSGHDVTSRSSPSLGETVGNLEQNISLGIPRRQIREHGEITVLMLVRPSPMFQKETLAIDHADFFNNYERLTGDSMFSAEEPTIYYPKYMFRDGGASDSTDMGKAPHLTHYRHHPNFTHDLFKDEDTGYQSRDTPTTRNNLIQCQDYDDVFASLVTGHYKSWFINRINVNRNISSQGQSLMLRE